MTELRPTEQYCISQDGRTLPAQPAAPVITPELMVYFLEERRRSLITELRAVDKALGRPQTIPVKDRDR